MRSSFIAALIGVISANAENIGFYSSTNNPVQRTQDTISKTIYTSFPINGAVDYNNNVKGVVYSLDADSRTSTSDIVKGVLSNNDLLSGKTTVTSKTFLDSGSAKATTTGSTLSTGGSGLGYSVVSASGSGVKSGASYTISGGSSSGSASGLSLGGSYYSTGTISGGLGGGSQYSQYSPQVDVNRYYTGSQQNSNINSYRVINQASQSLITPTRSFDSIFLRFPSCGQLDKLILSADTAAILKTIQTIATDSSASCSQRITYLLQLVGRLKTAIEKKSYLAKQLKLVITTSVAEINRLQLQIDNNKKAISGLGIDTLKRKQAQIVLILQESYKKLNNVDGQTPVLQARVLGYEKQIQILNKNSQGERNRVANDKLKLVDVTSQIASLQSRLRELQDKQGALNLSISKGLAKIQDNEANVADLRKKIESIQIQIKNLRDQSDSINSQVRDLEVKVQRLRTDISVAETKKDRYLKQISALDDKINAEKKKVVEDDLARVHEMITTLKGLVPAVEGAIDRHYYNCYGNGAIKAQQNGDVVVYVISGDKFGDYLRNLYGTSVRVPSIRSDVTLNRVDIFGQEWTGKYGYPFVDSAFENSDFAFSGSFNCLNPGSLVTGLATISNIAGNYIEAKDERGGNLRFNLGSCSRLESTRKVPEVGHKFYWSGVPGGSGGQAFNLYGGSCFE